MLSAHAVNAPPCTTRKRSSQSTVERWETDTRTDPTRASSLDEERGPGALPGHQPRAGGLLHRHRLCQVTRLVDVQPLDGGEFAGEDLQRHDGQERRVQGRHGGHAEDDLGELIDG